MEKALYPFIHRPLQKAFSMEKKDTLIELFFWFRENIQKHPKNINIHQNSPKQQAKKGPFNASVHHMRPPEHPRDTQNKVKEHVISKRQ